MVALVDSAGSRQTPYSVPAIPGERDYSLSLPVTVPAANGYRVAISYRPDTSVWAWLVRWESAAEITVQVPA